MTASIELSPLGTARLALMENDRTRVGSRQEMALLAWLEQFREPLETEYNLDREIALIAWDLARWQPGLGASEHQALILLILLALGQVRQGSTRITVRGKKGEQLRFEFAQRLLEKARPVGGLSPLEPTTATALMEKLTEPGRASVLVGDPGDFKPLIVDGDHLYLQKMLHLENQFAAAVRLKLEAGVHGWPEREIKNALDDVRKRPARPGGSPVSLTDEQAEAVRAAVQSPIGIISGGPGTGKTTIVVSILRVLSRLDVAPEEIALAAPTGKAANRMLGAIQEGRRGIAEAIEADRRLVDCPDPRTLHRLLGYSPSNARFHHHENNRLTEKIVIVDEASMIDLSLMARLVRSLPEDGRLMLIGDARQLPSVDAGSVLRDLLKAREQDGRYAPTAVVLQESYRMRDDDPQGKNLLGVARKIDQGERPGFEPGFSGNDVVAECGSVDELDFRGVEFIASPAEGRFLHQFLERWESEGRRAQPDLHGLNTRVYQLSTASEFADQDRAMLLQLFAYWENSRILCMTRVLPTGSDRINECCHKRLLDRLESPSGDDQFIAGEPVMMQVNDYQRMIFNGDQGLILQVAEPDKTRTVPMAVFRRSGGFAPFHLHALRSALVLSYAMTVHKAQGSEFDRVALFLPDHDLPINTREILYTALTRARKSAVIIGTREIFEAGIKRTSERDSGIVEKLLA
jgi:exodeoxyribonuclease V alpha subunit